MDADIISLDPIVIEEIQEKPVIVLINETETILPETRLSSNRRFGIVDLWKIRNTLAILSTLPGLQKFSLQKYFAL